MSNKAATNKTAPQEIEFRYFRYFLVSALCCLAGLATIVYVNLLLPDSAEQEWYALGGLVLAVPSGLSAMYCYIRLLLSRFGNFLNRQ